jgi:dienelactone hydrolase
MATSSLTRHSLPGGLGDLLIDVRTGDRVRSRPSVIVLHGFKGFKDWGMFPVIAERLSKAGMAAVSFNVSGSGVDDQGEFSLPAQFGKNTYSAELEDLGRVVKAVAEGGPLGLPRPSSIGLLGHSRGGGIAILETARNPAIEALVTWAAIGSVDRWSEEAKAAWRRRGFVNISNARTGQVIPLLTDLLDDIDRHGGNSLDIPASAARIKVPWLIMHGQTDETVEVADADALHAAASGRPELQIIPESGHTFGAAHPLKEIPGSLDQAMTQTVGWLSRHLR